MHMLLVSAALAAGTPAAHAIPDTPVVEAAAARTAADPAPAMFVVQDTDTTVYLFGTFHALDGQSEWFGREVRDAFERSSELILETLLPERRTNAAVLPPPTPVYRSWPVNSSASFLSTTRLAIRAGRARGMQVDNGADMVLRRAAEAAGKPVAGLETIESQLSLFTRMPALSVAGAQPAGQTAPSGPTMNDLSDAMAEMQAAWKRGELSIFVRMLDELRRTSPGTYRKLFAERNSRWADWVGARMDTPGTVFVAVGAGHLAGSDSLLVRLAEMGIASARVD